jgi:restriction system protein
MARAFTWQSVTQIAILFVTGSNLARLDHVTGAAAALTGTALLASGVAHKLGWLPPGRDRQIWLRHLRKHRAALTKRYRQLVRINAYGAEEAGKWYGELDRFRAAAKLDLEGRRLAAFDRLATKTIKRWIAQDDREAYVEPAPEEMSPEDYEHHCAEVLRRAGWAAEVTGMSGDQGVDVLAERGELRVAIQCKLHFANPVGNKAVQEAHAAAGYVDAGHAAVVSNREFTRSAEQLAAKLGVLLLHDSELGELERHLPRSRERGAQANGRSRARASTA